MQRISYNDLRGEVKHEVLNMFLERYVFATKWLDRKKVIDAGCGEGLGTFIYSLAAKEIFAIDKSQGAIKKAKKLKPLCKTKYMIGDLNTFKLPKADVCVAIEVIEHLKPGNDFLKRLDVETLVFSIPINMPGDFHLQVWKDQDTIMQYLAEQGWNTTLCYVDSGDTNVRRDNASLVGVAKRVYA